MIVFRGLESDSGFVRNIATHYPPGNIERKLEWLNEQTDLERFFKAYQWNELPTRYLHSHTSYKKMERISDSKLREYGGQTGIELADYMKGKKWTSNS